MKGCEHLQRQILQDESQLIGDYEKCLINFCASCPPHLQKTRDDSGIKVCALFRSNHSLEIYLFSKLYYSLFYSKMDKECIIIFSFNR